MIPLLLKIEGKFPILNKKEFLRLVMQAFTGLFLFSVFLLYGLQKTSAIEAGIITGAILATTLLLAFLLLKERISTRKVIGILLAVVGVIIINIFGSNVSASNPLNNLFGNLLIFGAVIGEGLFTVLGKAASEKISPLAISTIISFLAFCIFLPLGIYQALSFDFTTLSVTEWVPIFYYGTILTVVTFFFWYKGVSKVPASTSSVFTSLIPISAVLLSVIFLKESLHLAEFLGMALVVFAVYFVASKTETAQS